MLNFERGRAIAIIHGGEMDGEIVYSDPSPKKKNKRKMVYESDSESDSDSDDERMNHIGLEEGVFIPLPRADQRECIEIAGKSGSGKTTWGATYAKVYKSLFPDRDIFVMSRCDVRNDPAFNGLDVLQIDINESILKTPIDIEKELNRPCLLIFDDITTIQNPKLKKAVEKLVIDGLEIARKFGVTVLFINHLLIDNDRGLARTVLHEIDKLVVFPLSGNPQQIKYCLTRYFEATDKEVKKMLKTKSRWLCISKEYPKVVLTEYECYVPNF